MLAGTIGDSIALDLLQCHAESRVVTCHAKQRRERIFPKCHCRFYHLLSLRDELPLKGRERQGSAAAKWAKTCPGTSDIEDPLAQHRPGPGADPKGSGPKALFVDTFSFFPAEASEITILEQACEHLAYPGTSWHAPACCRCEACCNRGRNTRKRKKRKTLQTLRKTSRRRQAALTFWQYPYGVSPCAGRSCRKMRKRS